MQFPLLPEAGSVYVAPNAYVIGKVRLGAGVNLWFGVTVRGDIEWIDIGADTNLQEGVILHTEITHPLTIGSGCTVGHGAILHGCSLQEGCLIGMHATVLNGASLGRFCLVGAHSLVLEGSNFPDYSLIVGSPARVARILTDQEIEKLRKSAVVYRKRAQNFYMQGLMEAFPNREGEIQFA
jgi:carbonic anhydrase/acetyltransferase-like protein (isoleucine patch superfamily)